MPRDLEVFAVEIPINNPEAMKKFQEAMDALSDAQIDYECQLAKEKNISLSCASDVAYLRTRSRWSEENEAELIRLHSIGQAPNIYEWP